MEHASQTEGPRTQVASAAAGLKSAMMTDHSPGGDRLRELSRLVNASPAVQRLQAASDSIQRKKPEEEPLQAKSIAPARANRTGLPDNLKSGIESLSGLSMDHVQVHRNSSRPAQLNAHAFAQGADIHLAPGQDQHLPHEAWHVVQQAQGRVKPTMQMKGGVPVNDDAGLEHEADVMGARALQRSASMPDPAKGNDEHIHMSRFERLSALVQRVVNAIPAGEFRSNLTWARWFQAMTEEEVGIEASRLGLAKAALENMNDILDGKGEALIEIPDDYADAAASGPGKRSFDAIADSASGSQSPFRAGSIPAPVSVSGKVARGKKTERRLALSPIKFTVMVKQSDETYEPKDRPKNIAQIPYEIFDFCYAHSGEAILLESGEQLAITQSDGHHIVFTTANVELLGEELAAIHAIRYEEAEPRSGAARAAADEYEGVIRGKRKKEAAYAPPSQILADPDDYDDYDDRIEADHVEDGSNFSSTISSGVIRNRIVHPGPWAKGKRVPSQMGVMGGQNAKNYYLDHVTFEGKPNMLTQTEKQAALDDIDARFEWLHIIGSSLGGPNVIGNLVCGTYDANTEMIALEHRVALWGKKGYDGDFQPTPANPILIEGDAVLADSGFVATTITLRVFHSGEPILERTYQAMRPEVITKTQYALAETGVEEDIDMARERKAPVKDDNDEGEIGTSSM